MLLMIDPGLAARARHLLAHHPQRLSDDEFLAEATTLHDLVEDPPTEQPAHEAVLLRRRMTQIWSRSEQTAMPPVEFRYGLFRAGHLDEPGPFRQLRGHLYCATVKFHRALSGERRCLQSAEMHCRDALLIGGQNSAQRHPSWTEAGDESRMTLAAILCCLYEQDRELLAAGGPTAQRIRAYVDEAIAQTEQPPAMPQMIHSWRAVRGRALVYRWSDADPAVRDAADIEGGISLLESAAAQPGHEGLGSQKLLADALIERRGHDDLVRAIKMLSAWIHQVPAEMAPAAEQSLAQARMLLSGDDQLFDASYRDALATGRLRIAWDTKTQHAGWLRTAGRTREAAHAYLAAFQVLPGLVGLQGERPDKEVVLLHTGRAASTAATDLIRSGSRDDLIAAVMLLEASRAVMLGEMLDLSGPQAKPGGPERARLARLSTEIVALENGTAGGQLSPWQIAERLERAYGDHAALTGNGTHGPPTVEVAGQSTWRTVCRAAQPAPLVYLTAGDSGGGAVIVPSGLAAKNQQPIGISLPRLDHPTVLQQVALLRRMDELQGQNLDPKTGESRIQIMTRVLETLWDCAMEKVVEELGGTRLAVLLAGGLLGMLPLHAAGEMPQERPQSWRFALDSMAFTYAPTVASMTWARAHRKDASRWKSLFVLAPPDDSPRPMSREAELEALSRLDGLVLEKIDTLEDRRTIMGALRRHDVFHFAGHGWPSATDPLSGGLYLSAGQTLQVASFLAEPPLPGRVAMIPGCSTAMIGDHLPEESVGLPTALLQAGFTDVMATQWSVEGGLMAGLIDGLYRRWREPGTHPAFALAGIQRELFRTGDNGRPLHPLYWAPFTHTGG
ncbi:CHAT domain-containing protein [Streptomyces sp. NPDC056738]|uniref:CHAT domain-containing protein n=1 Tax=Streptomyces sp. NPDC056738 TaxID=3345933 RepID=UPI00367A1BC9